MVLTRREHAERTRTTAEELSRGVVACWAPGVDGGSACVPAATYSRPERRRLDPDGNIQQNTFV